RPLRSPDAAGRTAVQIHRRHRVASVHGRADFLGAGLQATGAHSARTLPAALPHRHADLLHLPRARLSRGRTSVLPEMRRGIARPAAGRRREPTPGRDAITTRQTHPPLLTTR